MSKKYTLDDDADVRRALTKKLAGKTQAQAAREIGVPPQNLCTMVNGAAVTGKTLRWLGFEPVKGLYTRVPAEVYFTKLEGSK